MKNSEKNKVNGALGLVILAAVVVIATIIYVAILNGDVYSVTKITSYLSSATIPAKTFTSSLDSTAAPLGMSMLNDLTDYVSGNVYAIYSNTAQPHTVTLIDGVLATTWDGVNTVATFGGAVGDGITFRVISSTNIVIENIINVSFS